MEKKINMHIMYTLKKIMYMQTNLYGYYYYTCDLTACVDLYTKSDSW